MRGTAYGTAIALAQSWNSQRRRYARLAEQE